MTSFWYTFLVLLCVGFAYCWRLVAVNTYQFLKAQREYELQHSCPCVGDDSKLEHFPYNTFDGPRKGFVFRYGSKGVGYYEDKPKPLEMNTDSPHVSSDIP